MTTNFDIYLAYKDSCLKRLDKLAKLSNKRNLDNMNLEDMIKTQLSIHEAFVYNAQTTSDVVDKYFTF